MTIKIWVKEKGKPEYALYPAPRVVGFASDADPRSYVWRYETPDGEEPDESVYDHR